jgi:hypothetical protein
MGLLDPAPTPAPAPVDQDPFARTEAEETATPAADASASLVDRDTAIAAALVNQPIALPDGQPDEAPELDPGADFDPAELDDPDDTGEFDPILDEPTDADWAEFGAMADEAAARRSLDRSATLSLADLADHIASHFRGWHNGAGDLFARTLEELGQKIRFTHADTPSDYEARVEILDADRDDTHYRAGFEEGRQRGRSEAGAMADGQID